MEFVNWIKLAGMIVGLAVICLFLPLPMEADCYNWHVYECEEAHSQNKTFLYCSGFLIEPEQSHLDDKGCPAIHPEENCTETVPHGCVIPHKEWQTLIRFGE